MHCIRGFIGKEEIIKAFTDNWVEAKPVTLYQGLAIIFLTRKLYDDIEELANSKIDTEYSQFFEYLSPSIYEILVQESRIGKLAYIEIDYFGGCGSQSAILFENSKIKIQQIKIQQIKTETLWDEKTYNYYHKPEGEKAINIVLKELGVYKVKGKDEFDSIGLGKYRHID